MPDRIRARVLVTALLILLTVAGIRAIGPGGHWTRPPGHVVIVGVVLEVLFAAMFVTLRWRRQPPPAGDLAGRLHRIVSAAVVTAFLGVLFGLVLYLIDTSPGQSGHRGGRVIVKPTVLRSPAKVRIPPGHGLPLRDVLIAILLVAIIVVLIAAWRRRRAAGLRLAVPADLGVDEAADELARAVESGRMALRDIDDARAAIIACYVAMEQSLAEAGAARAAAETPDELLARAVAADLVPRGPAALLTELFYEARYSTHHMPASKRDQAEQALADIAADLPAGQHA